MNATLEIQTDRKEIQKFNLQFFFSLLHDLKWTNEPRREFASYLKQHNPFIDDTLRYTQSSTSKLNSLQL
jgi:hypothetical protein